MSAPRFRRFPKPPLPDHVERFQFHVKRCAPCSESTERSELCEAGAVLFRAARRDLTR